MPQRGERALDECGGHEPDHTPGQDRCAFACVVVTRDLQQRGIIVWGGESNGVSNTGALYDPMTNTCSFTCL